MMPPILNVGVDIDKANVCVVSRGSSSQQAYSGEALLMSEKVSLQKSR